MSAPLVNWYTHDAEYVSLDEIREEAWGIDGSDPRDEDIAAFIEHHGLKPADCNLCDRPLPADAAMPLCDRCSGTARAHARLDRATKEWEADGRPD